MVNLRYHIVSLVAVFLALAVGIVVGSTVVDRAIVDTLNDRITVVENRANATAQENRLLGAEVELWRAFGAQSRDELVAGTLEGIPVLVMASSGVDAGVIEDVVETLGIASASLAGTVILTSKLLLPDATDARDLALILEVSLVATDTLRRVAVERLAAVVSGAAEPGPWLSSLADAGFLTFEAPPRRTPGTAGPSGGVDPGPPSGLAAAVASVRTTAGRVVVVAGPTTSALEQALVQPLLAAMAQAQPRRAFLVAGDGRKPLEGGSGVVDGLRSDDSLLGRVSTVDNVQAPTGQAAAALALRDLAASRTGHYGVGPGAQRQVPLPTG